MNRKPKNDDIDQTPQRTPVRIRSGPVEPPAIPLRLDLHHAKGHRLHLSGPDAWPMRLVILIVVALLFVGGVIRLLPWWIIALLLSRLPASVEAMLGLVP